MSIKYTGISRITQIFNLLKYNFSRIGHKHTKSDIQDFPESMTPTSHASNATTYGAGTTVNYGHVKTQTGDMNGTSSTNGIAAGLGHTHSQYRDIVLKRYQTDGITNGKWYRLFTVSYHTYNYLMIRVIVKSGYIGLTEVFIRIRFEPSGANPTYSMVKLIGSLDDSANYPVIVVYKVDDRTVGIASYVYGGASDVGFEILDIASESQAIPASAIVIDNPFVELETAPTAFCTHRRIDGDYSHLSNLPDLGNYVAKAGDTMTGLLTAPAYRGSGGRTGQGGDDEGIVVGFANNGHAGVCLGIPNGGKRSVFYLKSDSSKPFWRYHSGTAGPYDLYHPGKGGTIAITDHSHSFTPAGTISSPFTGSAVTSGVNSGSAIAALLTPSYDSANKSLTFSTSNVAPNSHTHSVTAAGTVNSTFTGTAGTTGTAS